MSNQDDMKELRERVERLQSEIDRLKRGRNEYLRMSAHQLKSPLSTISFSIDTLLKEYAGRLNWRQLRVIESIKNSTNNLQSLIHDILDLEKLRSEKMDFENLDYLKICTEAVDELHRKIEERAINLEINMPHRMLVTYGNQIALKQVVYNLLENAVKYSFKGGEVNFTVEYDDREKIIISVIRDKGIGIPEDEQQHLFDEFYRAPNARIFDKTGTGFGMAIVKRVLDLCEGSIEVWSRENEGMRVTFILPLVKVGDKPSMLHKKSGPHKKIIIVGGVAAGPKAASRARRLDPDAEITLFEKGRSLAYAGCTLPYYISGMIKSRKELSFAMSGSYDVAGFFRKVKDIDIKNLTEVVSIDRKNKTIQYKDLVTERVSSEAYDALVLATGSSPILPNLEGIDYPNVFKLHDIQDAEKIKLALINETAENIVIIGGGLIGIEVADVLTVSGARVTIVEGENQILSFLDPEMAALVERYMIHRGIRIIKGTHIKAFKGRDRVKYILLPGQKLNADIVILALGVKPNVELARKADIKIGPTGAIAVNEYLQTSDPSIYAIGDCAETRHILLDKPYYLPLGSIANRQGRTAGANATGMQYSAFEPIAGTIIFKVFDLHIGKTGLNEKEIAEVDCEPVSCYVPQYDREHFIPGAEIINIKMIACKKTRKLLGVQIIGRGDVSKRIDIAAMTISRRGTIDDILSVDFGYAPAFANATGAIVVAANVLRNKLDGRFEGVSAETVQNLLKSTKKQPLFLDVRSVDAFEEGRIEGVRFIPLETLKTRMDEIPKDKDIILICDTGARSYQAALILKSNGFEKVRILEGGLSMWPFKISRE